jgi:molybdopterin-binding protein
LENTYNGVAKVTEGGTTLVDIGNGVQIETTAHSIGEVSIFVAPQDIIISKTPLTSSARNIFKGKIVEIQDKGSLVKLKVDIGKPLTVQITKLSFNEMGLNLNIEIYVAFKASSVQAI